MRKVWISIGLAALFLALNGCGGSTSTPTSGIVGGSAFSEFRGTLPDGSLMAIEILDNTAGHWAGDFAVMTETGAFAHQTGSFEGSITGNAVHATCETVDGAEFTLDGTAHGDVDLQLTRSDIPGTVLSFDAVRGSAPAARADLTFNLNTGSTNARVTLSGTPYSSTNLMTEYRGTWSRVPVTFWAYPSGFASIVIYADPQCINVSNFASYKITDFPSATKNSDVSQTSTYSTVAKTQLKFRGTVTVSP
jgi:hypothetical protein